MFFLFYYFAYSALSASEELNICILGELFAETVPPLVDFEKKKKKNLEDLWDLDCDHLALWKEISQVLARGILGKNKLRIKVSKLLK